MDERLKFIARLLDGEKMAGLCREFGIPRKTATISSTRYNAIGLDGLSDRSRRPDAARHQHAASESERRLAQTASTDLSVPRSQ